MPTQHRQRHWYYAAYRIYQKLLSVNTQSIYRVLVNSTHCVRRSTVCPCEFRCDKLPVTWHNRQVPLDIPACQWSVVSLITGVSRIHGTTWSALIISINQPIWQPINQSCNLFRVVLRIYTSIFPQSQFYCILALGSGQRLLYRLGSGLGLVLVLVLRFCALNLINSYKCVKL